MNELVRWHKPVLATVPSFGWLRNEIDRLFEAPLAEFGRTSQLFSGWQPPLDMYEDKDNLFVRVELPGMKKEDIEVSVHDGSLSISGERKHEEKHENADVYRAERFFGCFQRTVSLPSAVMADKVKAQYKDGILMVALPKTEEAKPKRIDVSVG